jgi:CheY-like chemotaxis protein
LLVEDHRVTADIVRTVLEEAGHQVELANDMASALQLADAHVFELLMSDLGLPDGSGHDLLNELRTRGHHFPAVALSGFGREEDVERSYEAGFAAHLTKPASRDAVVAAVAGAVKGAPVPARA